jgi:hypothetical protein
MPGRVWESRNVHVGPGGNPPDVIINRIPYMETTPEKAREEALARMRILLANKSSVEGIVIVNGEGATITRVTAWDCF